MLRRLRTQMRPQAEPRMERVLHRARAHGGPGRAPVLRVQQPAARGDGDRTVLRARAAAGVQGQAAALRARRAADGLDGGVCARAGAHREHRRRAPVREPCEPHVREGRHAAAVQAQRRGRARGRAAGGADPADGGRRRAPADVVDVVDCYVW